MTVLIVLLAFILVLALLTQSFGTDARHRSRVLMRHIEDEHERTMTMMDAVGNLLTTQAAALNQAASRDSLHLGDLLEAGRADRRALISALLASNSTDPRAAQRFGIVERDLDRGERAPHDIRDLLERAAGDGIVGDRERMATEFTDERGQPITPSGMG